MKALLQNKYLTRAIQQRNYAYVVSSVLLLSNLMLVSKVIFTEEQWVLVPQFDTDHRIPLRRSLYSNEYITNWAEGLLVSILTSNESTIDRRIQEFLILTTESHNRLRKKLKEDAKRMKEDRISTAYYPKHFTINRSKSLVHIKGEFQTFFGGDKKPISQEKTFALVWKSGPRGLLLIDDLYEVKRNEQ